MDEESRERRPSEHDPASAPGRTKGGILHPRRRMRHIRPGRYKAPGTAPGQLHRDPEATPTRLEVMAYGPDGLEERSIHDPRELRPLLQAWPVVWIDAVGFGTGAELQALGEVLGLHPLALEDVVNVGQRAKVDAYEDELYIVGRMASSHPPETEQVSLFLGPEFLLVIQEREGDPFEGVRQRLRAGSGRIRQRGADYLAYALLDAIVDSYFPALDGLADELEHLEAEVLDMPDAETVSRIHAMRRTLIGLRKSITPHREAVNSLLRDHGGLVTAETSLFLRDVYDHVLRIVELAETYREMTSDLMSTYLSVVSNKMNEVMKVLTVIATIFIPLSFVAGVYGMNFDPGASPWNMPELGWRYGYPFALGVMAAIALGLLWYMWRRGWLD